jgi:dihydrofolate synthase/folylpolyglutamate synthase
MVSLIRPHAAALAETEHGHPTEFEIKTALAFLYFAEREVDFAVLEVGLGGRLDATNIVNPLVSVITNVSMDHMDRLGNTLAEIAAEKAGIIKLGGHVVTAAEGEALDVIRRTCEERNSELRLAQPLNGDLKLGMKGDFQHINAATAIEVVEVLRERGISIPEKAVRTGLEKAYLPGRLEVLREKPTLLIDGAHNLDGARKLADALRKWFGYRRLILVMGMVSGHSVEDVVGTLAPMADRFIATAPRSIRAASSAQVADAARAHCPDVTQIELVADAVRSAMEAADDDDLVCVTGSFYTIGEVVPPLAG